MSPPLCQMFLTLATMIPAILKLYFIGTFVIVLAVFYSMADSIGALAHPQDHSSMWELKEMKAEKKSPPGPRPGGRSAAKHVNS